MCLITFAYNAHPDYKFILTANRDEFYARPTQSAHWWKDHPHIFGGRDLQAHGTWMAIGEDGKFAAVTNYRDLRNIRPDANSRGDLPVNFLLGDDPAESYAKSVQLVGKSYNGFNLLVMDDELVHASNYDRGANNLKPGIYGLSNALLDTPWPKVTRSKRTFSELIQTDFTLDDLILMMQDEATAPDNQLPETGLDYDREKALSAMCIRTPDYGTCCTTAITIDYDGKVAFMEKSYPVGQRKDHVVTDSFKTQA